MKRILLTKGKEAFVDDADYELVSRFKWRVQKHGRTFYAICTTQTNGRRYTTRMHRLIVGLHKGDLMEVDHIDHDGLNNCRHNLRIVTHQQNSENRRYPGFRTLRSGKFQARVCVGDKRLSLGVWDDPRMARAAYLCGKQLFNPIGGK